MKSHDGRELGHAGHFGDGIGVEFAIEEGRDVGISQGLAAGSPLDVIEAELGEEYLDAAEHGGGVHGFAFGVGGENVASVGFLVAQGEPSLEGHGGKGFEHHAPSGVSVVLAEQM